MRTLSVLQDATMRCCLLVLLALLPFAATAQHHGHHGGQGPYAGYQSREVAALSPDDLAALRAGAGWGLALPAELNGWPGPRHVLELADALDLSAEQRRAVQAEFDGMLAEAVPAGERLIAAEKALDTLFANGTATPEALRAAVDAAAEARATLRYVHLSRHLATRALLTPAQVAHYNRLRGYRADPCAAVPEGHNPAMWRKHNSCQ